MPVTMNSATGTFFPQRSPKIAVSSGNGNGLEGCDDGGSVTAMMASLMSAVRKVAMATSVDHKQDSS
jgi:hypothetical protein